MKQSKLLALRALIEKGSASLSDGDALVYKLKSCEFYPCICH